MQNIKQEIINYINTHAGTSFVELERLFTEHGYDYTGDCSFSSDEDLNLIYWQGWNAEAFQIISELRRDGYIEMKPASTFIYMIDGKGLTLPIAKTTRLKRNPHWFPVCYSKGHRQYEDMTSTDSDKVLVGGAE